MSGMSPQYPTPLWCPLRPLCLLCFPSAQVLIDAVVHAVNEDYKSMAGDFIKLGFLTPGTDITPIVPALEKIWADSKGQALSDFNFRTVTSKFNELVYQYPIRIPERYSLVIRSLLTQVRHRGAGEALLETCCRNVAPTNITRQSSKLLTASASSIKLLHLQFDGQGYAHFLLPASLRQGHALHTPPAPTGIAGGHLHDAGPHVPLPGGCVPLHRAPAADR